MPHKYAHGRGDRLYTKKFMLTIDQSTFDLLSQMGSEHGVRLQQFIRARIIPDWLKWQKDAKKGK